MTSVDEGAFKEWLHACLDPETVDAESIVRHASDALTLISIYSAKTDEQVYIRLFSRKAFRDLTPIKQSQVKKAAILAHHFLKSVPG